MAQCREHIDLFLFFGSDRVVPRASCLVAEAFERFDALARVLCRQRCTSHITLPCRDVRRAHDPLVLQTKNPRPVPLPSCGVDRSAHLTRALFARRGDALLCFGLHVLCGTQIQQGMRKHAPCVVVLTLPQVDRGLRSEAEHTHVRVPPAM